VYFFHVNHKVKRLVLWGNYIRKKLAVHCEIIPVVQHQIKVNLFIYYKIVLYGLIIF